jgi:hypothetical protein
MNSLQTYNGTIVESGRTYMWSGCVEGYMRFITWKDERCRITAITPTEISVYDYKDKKISTWQHERLRVNGIKFRKPKFLFF